MVCVLATPPLTLSELHTLCSPTPQVVSPVAIFDLNYGERARSSARWAEELGALYLDGSLMLAEQGRRSFERWTGALPPLERSLVALTS
jgi:shikimate 5-dehydrogenase